MPPRFPSMPAIMGTMLLVGCTTCPRDEFCSSSTEAHSTRARLRDHAVADPKPRKARVAKRESSERPARQGAGLLSPQNQAQFLELPAIEIVGRSRSYTGDQLDPNTCAERCLADTACDAFAFDIGTKICYSIGQITASNPNPSFVSGRKRVQVPAGRNQ